MIKVVGEGRRVFDMSDVNGSVLMSLSTTNGIEVAEQMSQRRTRDCSQSSTRQHFSVCLCAGINET